MKIADNFQLIETFINENKNIETPENIPMEVLLGTILTNAQRTLLSLQTGRNGLFAVRSDSTGLAFILKITKVKKGDKPAPELIAILPFFKGGKSKSSGIAALEKQLDFYVRDRLKAEKHRVNSAKKAHEIIEFGELRFTYWEGTFYDSNMIDMIIIK